MRFNLPKIEIVHVRKYPNDNDDVFVEEVLHKTDL